ncbi:MAG: DinB family protein [Proteobacteria bacterium]|nr:DinB family protein [Pseudomonadota bacterium]
MFEELRKEIESIVGEWSSRLNGFSNEIISNRRNNQNRTVRQILGHLVDSAANNHHRIVRLQYVTDLDFPDYRQDNDRWIAIQNYQSEDFKQLVTLWESYNLHLVHVIENVYEGCLNNTWKDFEGNEETLKTVIEGYLWHLNLHLKEIEDLIK